ncbi:MAG: hypothetical protein ACOX50_03165 [Patescibacteria group bacterium]|jgi:hypothetical protein
MQQRQDLRGKAAHHIGFSPYPPAQECSPGTDPAACTTADGKAGTKTCKSDGTWETCIASTTPPKACSYGKSGDYACASPTECVQCVDGTTRRPIEGQEKKDHCPLPCKETPAPKSCSYGAHGEYACLDLTHCVLCNNGETRYNQDRSHCNSLPCGISKPATATPTPRPATKQPENACSATELGSTKCKNSTTSIFCAFRGTRDGVPLNQWIESGCGSLGCNYSTGRCNTAAEDGLAEKLQDQSDALAGGLQEQSDKLAKGIQDMSDGLTDLLNKLADTLFSDGSSQQQSGWSGGSEGPNGGSGRGSAGAGGAGDEPASLRTTAEFVVQPIVSFAIRVVEPIENWASGIVGSIENWASGVSSSIERWADNFLTGLGL